jgi:hypothetical protein
VLLRVDKSNHEEIVGEMRKILPGHRTSAAALPYPCGFCGDGVSTRANSADVRNFSAEVLTWLTPAAGFVISFVKSHTLCRCVLPCLHARSGRPSRPRTARSDARVVVCLPASQRTNRIVLTA